MTDRYLFRGFHKEENGKETIYIDGQPIKGKWVEGFYWTNGLGNHFIRVIKKEEGNFSKFTIEDFEIIPETIGQYLNKQDKNGRKIFENDLLKGCEDMYDDEVIGTPVLNLEHGLQLHCKYKIYHFDYIYDEEVTGTKFDKEVNDND